MRILEAGHYYVAKGPTLWSYQGWRILEELRQKGDRTLLFVDDIHPLERVPPIERHESHVNGFAPPADHLFYESAMHDEALEVLERLKELPKKNRARCQNGVWFCSGFPITHQDGKPLCVLLDAGLSLKKLGMGYSEAVNILPHYYEGEQRKLLRLVRKAIPALTQRVILFDHDRWWEMS